MRHKRSFKVPEIAELHRKIKLLWLDFRKVTVKLQRPIGVMKH